MDRRQAIERVVHLLGGALTAPTLAGLVAGCGPATSRGREDRFLGEQQLELVRALVDEIIPPTDTPGAADVGVHLFVDEMLGRFFSPARRDRFVAGLAGLEERARARTGGGFLAASPEARHALLSELDAAAFPSPASPIDEPDVPGDAEQDPNGFWRSLKELTVTGYYTSEVGQTVELHVMPLGPLDADVPLEEVGRTWA